MLDADPRRIKRLKIWPLAARGAEAGAASRLARRQGAGTAVARARRPHRRDRAKFAGLCSTDRAASRRAASVTTAAASATRREPLRLARERVVLSSGWRRRAIAFVSGAVGALALPPFSLVALMVVADDASRSG